MSSMNGMTRYMDHILLQEKLECLEFLTTSNNPHKRLMLNVCLKLAWHYLGLYFGKAPLAFLRARPDPSVL